MIPIKVSVTKEHIIEGNCCSNHSCAIALALADAFPDIQVSGLFIRTKEHDFVVDSSNDREVFRFVDQFDACDMEVGDHPAEGKDRLKYVKPFSFILKVQEEAFPEDPEKYLKRFKNLELA
jgi:hypothetical protein